MWKSENLSDSDSVNKRKREKLSDSGSDSVNKRKREKKSGAKTEK